MADPKVGSLLNRIATSWANPTDARNWFIAALQLHEYWSIDENEDEASDETLQSYMERLNIAPFPGLGEPVIYSIRVEDLPPLVEPDMDVLDGVTPVTWDDEPVVGPEPDPAPAEQPAAPAVEASAPTEERRRVPRMLNGLPVIRALTVEEKAQLKTAIGVGSVTLTAMHVSGREVRIPNARLTEIPECFLEMVDG